MNFNLILYILKIKLNIQGESGMGLIRPILFTNPLKNCLIGFEHIV